MQSLDWARKARNALRRGLGCSQVGLASRNSEPQILPREQNVQGNPGPGSEVTVGSASDKIPGQTTLALLGKKLFLCRYKRKQNYARYIKISILKEKIITKYYLTVFNYKGFSVLFLEPWQHKQASSYKCISQLLGFLESVQGHITGEKEVKSGGQHFEKQNEFGTQVRAYPRGSFQFWTGILKVRMMVSSLELTTEPIFSGKVLLENKYKIPHSTNTFFP